MGTISVAPEAVRLASGRVVAPDAVGVPAARALASAADAGPAGGDPALAAALTEFVLAWGRALPSLLDSLRQQSAAMRAAADIYAGTDKRVADAR